MAWILVIWSKDKDQIVELKEAFRERGHVVKIVPKYKKRKKYWYLYKYIKENKK